MPEDMAQQVDAGAAPEVTEAPVVPAVPSAAPEDKTLELQKRISGLDRDNARLRRQAEQHESERANWGGLQTKIDGLESALGELTRHMFADNPEAVAGVQGKLTESRNRLAQGQAQGALEQRLNSIGGEVLEVLTEAGLDPDNPKVQKQVTDGNLKAASPSPLERMEGLRRSAVRVALQARNAPPPETEVKQRVAEELKKGGLFDAETTGGKGGAGDDEILARYGRGDRSVTSAQYAAIMRRRGRTP